MDPLRRIAARVANIAARGVVQLVNDAKKLQLVQLGVLEDEDVDDGEHFQPYGFSSVPLVGAEAVVVFPGGDRGHPLVVAVSDRRYRPTGGQPGEVTVYNHTGAKVRITKDGDLELTPAPGRKTIINGANTGPGLAGEGVVVGTGIDPFTGQTYNALQNASTSVFAKK